MDNIEKQMLEDERLAQYDGTDAMITSWDLRDKLKEKDEHLWSVDFGMYRLDELTGGIRQGNLVIILGLTGEGKTLLMQTITKNICTSVVSTGEMPALFSLEVPPQQFLDQFGDKLPLFILPGMIEDSSYKWITERILEAKVKYGTRIFFLDHLHYIVPFQNNMSLVIGQVMQNLKKFAVKHGIAIVLLCHTKKIENGGELSMDSARDSSFISQESDTFLAIWRKDEKFGIDNEAMIKLCKCRATGQRNKYIHIKKVGHYLEEDMEQNA